MNNTVKFKGRGLFEVDLDSIISDKNDPIAPLIDENKEVYYEEFITESEALKWRNSNKRIVEKYQHINEETYKNLVQMSDAKRKARAKKLKTRYLGVTPGRGWIKFSTESQRIRGKYYTQYIKLAEAKDMKYFKEFNSREIVRLFMSGDVQVYCSCLRADTKIKLLDGSCPTVRDMMNRFNSGENLWVYSVDSDGNFKPGKVNKVFISGKASKLLRITLDNGKSVETTCDHLFMKRDGSYCKAEELKVGDSLMPLYFKDTDNGYELVKFNKYPDGYHSVYKEVAKEVFSESDWGQAKERSGEEDIAVHHVDYNKKNNSPENLCLMGVKEHIKFHADFINDRKKNDEEFREKNLEGVRKHIRKLNDNPTEAMLRNREKFIEKGRKVCETQEWREAQSKLMKEVIDDYWSGLSKEERSLRQKKIYEDNPEIIEKMSQARKEYWSRFTKEDIVEKNKDALKMATEACKNKWESMSDEERVKLFRKRTATRYKNIIDKMIQNGEEVNEENFLNKFSKIRRQKYKETPYGKYFNSLKEVLEYLGEPYSTYNHKVESIEVIYCDEEEVFDISVEKYHNFYVDAGVIVHNCPDFHYRMKYAAYHLGYGIFREDRYPKIRNPNFDYVLCKHLICVLKVLGLNWTMISRDMKNTKFYKRKAEDEEYMRELEKKKAFKKKMKKGK